MSLLLLLLCMAAVAMFLSRADKAHVRAVRVCRATCQDAGVQLLDQTVVLRKMRYRRVAGRWRMVRSYAFDFSIDGQSRGHGHLDLCQEEITHLALLEADGRALLLPAVTVEELSHPLEH
jgi:Protein of unknown function (DUF3301)